MTNITEEIKYNHEIFVCKTFLDLYKKEVNFIRHGNPVKHEPDCVCDNNKAIEVVGIYDSEQQAEKLWDNNLDIKTGNNFCFDLFAFENLNKNIFSKLSKLNNGLYDGFYGDIILVCDILSPSVKSKDVEMFIRSYIPFKNNDENFEKYFFEIWVLWRQESDLKFKINKLE